MNRYFGGAMLVAIGIILGSAMSFSDRREVVAEEPGTSVADQLSDIRTQVKEINTQLRSGTVKVIVVLNPDSN
jgi:hypothetical protein